MEESQFYVPNITQDNSAQRIEQYLKNLQGVFSVQINLANHIVFVRHSQKMKRRELSRTLSHLGYPEQIMA